MTGKPPHIKVMTPCYGGQVSANYAASLIELLLACEKQNIWLDCDLRDGGTDIVRARNDCVATFLEDADATHLLFIDADIGFAPEQVFRLLNFDADFTAAVYPLKELDWRRIATAVDAGHPDLAAALFYALAWAGPNEITAWKDFTRVPYVGVGFTMIRRSALVRLADSYAARQGDELDASQESNKENVERLGLFDCMIEPETGMYLSECFSFCRRWTDIGGEIWLDIRSKLSHVGLITFHGDLIAQFEPESGTT